MEKALTKKYNNETRNINKKLQDYLSKFGDEEKAKLQEVKDGKLSTAEFKAWKVSIVNSNACKKILQDAAKQYARINQNALRYINSQLVDIYMLNYKISAKQIEDDVNAKI